MLQVGERFDPSGYDIIESLHTYNRDVKFAVLNNNSSHFLVVRYIITPTEGWEPLVVLVQSYRYWADPTKGPTALEAWLAAVSAMFLAVKWISEEEGED